MPTVTTVNPIKLLKPGATSLLAATDNRRQEQVVLAYQRYGRGKAIAMPIQDSWIWRMDVKMPVTDTTHQMFWRRLVRWLVDGVPEQVNITTTNDRVEPGEAVKLTAEVLDRRVRRGQRQPRRRVNRRAVGQDDRAARGLVRDEGRRLPRQLRPRGKRASIRSRSTPSAATRTSGRPR